MPFPSNRDARERFFRNEAKNRDKQRPRRLKGSSISTNFTRRAFVGHTLYDAAKDHKEVIVSYTKITEDFATRIWTVEPYSYRYRYLTGGGRWQPPVYKKVLFGYDVVDDRTKMFMYSNILDVTITENTFYPRWEVQIQYATLSEGYGGSGLISTTR
jgi:hypothetical protein